MLEFVCFITWLFIDTNSQMTSVAELIIIIDSLLVSVATKLHFSVGIEI